MALDELLAARSKLRQPTKEERAQWAAAERQRQARKEQAEIELLAAVEARRRVLAELDAEVARALLAAHELGVEASAIQTALGVSRPTYFRRIAAAQDKAAPGTGSRPPRALDPRRYP